MIRPRWTTDQGRPAARATLPRSARALARTCKRGLVSDARVNLSAAAGLGDIGLSMVAQIRAALPLQSLRVLETIAGSEHTRVLRRLRPETLERLRSVARLDWLPIEIDVELGLAVADVLGPDVDRERSRLCVLHIFETPLLRPFVQGAHMLFGLSPPGLIASIPRGWPAIYRHAGVLRYEVSDGLRRVLIYDDVPPRVLASRLYLDSIAGALESVFDLANVEGSVTLGAIDLVARRVELVFEWS